MSDLLPNNELGALFPFVKNLYDMGAIVMKHGKPQLRERPGHLNIHGFASNPDPTGTYYKCDVDLDFVTPGGETKRKPSIWLTKYSRNSDKRKDQVSLKLENNGDIEMIFDQNIPDADLLGVTVPVDSDVLRIGVDDKVVVGKQRGNKYILAPLTVLYNQTQNFLNNLTAEALLKFQQKITPESR